MTVTQEEKFALAAPDRMACAQKLTDLLSGAQTKSSAVFKLALVDFRSFNDIFGRHYGDLLLEQVNTYLAGFEGAEVLRSGGVEFLLILRGSGYARAGEIGEEICDRFNETWRIGDMDFVCAMSLGIVLPPLAAEKGEALLEMLDSAEHEAYLSGQNTAVTYTEELRENLLRTKAIATRLKNALAVADDPDLEVCYRPTVLYDAHRYTRAESYVRLFSDTYGLVSEATLIPIAEQSGLACALNLYAIRHTCALIRKLLEEKRSFETIAVPISAVQFLQPDFDQELSRLLEEYGIPAEKLALEVTESALINSFTQVNYMMQQIAELGVELVLSDFGTGYSGINNVLDLPVSVLKLDRLFVLQLENDERCGCVIEGLISIAHKLGMKVIAEGVETDHQRELLAGWGCDYQQGFYYSATVHADELVGMLSMPRPEDQVEEL